MPKNRHKDKDEDLEPRRPAYFLWFLANILALCFAVVSWVVCLHVFGKPENPRNYAILKKLERLPELKRYSVLDVPNGNALDPSELYEKYFGLSEEERQVLNTLLLRNYMRNFEKTLLLTYAEGDYQVVEIRTLGEGDFISSGVVVRAQAMVRPDDFTEAVGFPVVIEYIFPTDDQRAVDGFSIGDILEVEKNPNCAAVIHVSKVTVEDEPALQLTLAPIAYGSYRVGEGNSFKIEPPVELHPEAGLPIWK